MQNRAELGAGEIAQRTWLPCSERTGPDVLLPAPALKARQGWLQSQGCDKEKGDPGSFAGQLA